MVAACGESATTCPHAGCADEITRLTRERDEAIKRVRVLERLCAVVLPLH